MKHLYTTIMLVLSLSLTTLAQQEVLRPAEISKATYFDVSPPLREMPVIEASKRDLSWKDGIVKNKVDMPDFRNLPLPEATDADFKDAQNFKGNREGVLLQSFNGVGNVSGYLPPDTQGDVGPNHYMQMVNAAFAIWDKSGNLLYGPVDNRTLWNGFPGPWSSSNDGDPVVIYDEQADRWVASQFALPNYPNGPFYELIAVSQTGDPTGSWYRYAFTFTNMPDYPKLGVWRDGYYLSVNSFTSGSLNWNGTGVAALERDKMLVGDPNASMVFFTTPASGNPSSFLPADCDGAFPPEGSPAIFAYGRDGSTDMLVLHALQVDWETPANSTFTELISLPTMPFSSNINSVPQPGTSVTLQTISNRLMYRLQYRNFGTYQAMVANHTVNVSGHAGIRWYELRNSGSGWSIYQQGTYSPDATSRWMGSIAMNEAGDIALGFSASSSSVYPSIRFTGRYANDPLGVMTIAEQDIVAGGGSQTSSYQRWGDYSMMSVDPAHPDVFWYTQEYYQSTSNQSWKTRIGAFTFGTPLMAVAVATPDTICAGESATLSAQVSGASGDVVYEWTSSPGSFTSDLPEPVVTPDVTTVYSVTVTSDSNSATSSVEVVVNEAPLVSVPDDLFVCAGAQVALSAQLSGQGEILWTSDGDGTFSNPAVLSPEYLPGVQDIESGSVLLKINVNSSFGCGSASDSLNLTVNKAPSAEAGPAYESCGAEPVQLAGVATDYSAVMWSTLGDGTFTSPGSAEAIYAPGIADLEAGMVELIFNVTGNVSCADASDTTLLSISPAAVVEAGPDQEICAGENIQLVAEAVNYSSFSWETSGDGQFTDASAVETTYQPGAADLINGQASISAKITGLGACPQVEDQLLLLVHPLPVVSAGNDTTICKTASILLTGVAQHAGSYQWVSNGNGSFQDASALNTVYFPGTQDTVGNGITLSLNVSSLFGCGEASAQKNLQFAECLGIDNIGKAEIKILPNPTNGLFSVEISGMPELLKFRISVTDARGEVIVDQAHQSNGSLFKTKLDLSNYAKGIYLLKLSAGVEATVVKVIVQ